MYVESKRARLEREKEERRLREETSVAFSAEDLALATGNEAIVGLILKKRMDLLSVNQPSVPSNTSNDLADTHGDCKICFEPKNGVFAFSPCFHAVACKDCCARIIEGDDNKCPICRKEVNEFKKIFM